jgi:hypothetical protein
MHAPLDPECPKASSFFEGLFNDPMTEAYGAPVDDIVEGFERSHRMRCKQCQMYGAANIEVVD